MLDCSSFEDRIHQLLDDRLTLTGDELLMSHAAQCESCETMLVDYESVEDSVKLLPMEIELILDQQSNQKMASNRTLSNVGWVMAISACFLLIFGMFESENRDRPNSQIANNVITTPQLSIAAPIHTPVIQNIIRKPIPRTSPLSSRFRLADQMPKIPTVPTWENFSAPFAPMINCTNELPCMRTFSGSVSLTLELIRQSFSNSDSSSSSDLGWFHDAHRGSIC
jgi:hypothetical protein